jgi:exosortase/archaeosortase family protein
MTAKPRRARTFLLAALAWSLGLFTLLRTPWVAERLVLPLTQLQKQAADYYAGSPAVPIAVTAECSGTDALALCLAAILAYPVSRRSRLAAAAGAVALILALNTVRIATLGRAAASPALFRALHLQVWPAILVLAAAAYVFAWMRTATRPDGGSETTGPDDGGLPSLVRRFAPRAAVLLAGFALCGPAIARSETLIAAGAWTASAAAFILTTAGLAARASGNVLATSRGAFMVTPDCLATALVPLYAAAVLTARVTGPRRALALLAGPPLFAALAVARLLLLALPPALAASPLFLVHGFHQIVLAVAIVVLLALWRERAAAGRWPRAARRAAVALAAGGILAVVAGAPLTSAILGVARAAASFAPRTITELTSPGDAQGALAILPAFQAALLLALGMTALVGWRRLLWAFGALLVSQVALLVVLGDATGRAGLETHALLLRAWAVGVPVGLTLAMLRAGSAAAATPVGLRPAADGPR